MLKVSLTSFLVCSVTLLFVCCNGDVEPIGQKRTESIAEIKYRLWRELPTDPAQRLKTSTALNLREHAPIERPGSFLLSNDGDLYVNDNINGRVFRIAPDLTSAREVPLDSNNLIYPMRMRNNGSNLTIYENGTVRTIDAGGRLVKAIKTFVRIEDFDLIAPESYLVSLGDVDFHSKSIAVLDSNGKKLHTFGTDHNFAYPEVESRAFIQAINGMAVVGYKYMPLIEIYDIKERKLVRSISITSNIFPHLTALKSDREFSHPEPAVFRIAKYIGGLKVLGSSIYVLLHTPNPSILELGLEGGNEINRYVALDSEAMEYFGFEVQTSNASKRFFVGGIGANNAPALFVLDPISQQQTGGKSE